MSGDMRYTVKSAPMPTRAAPIRTNVANEPERQRIDVRVDMLMVEALRVEAQSEDLLRRDLDASIHGRASAGAKIPFQKVAVRVIVEAVVLLVVSPRQSGGERA